MASKRRSRAVEIMPIRTNYSTRRAKSSQQTKKVEDKKLISEQPSIPKNAIRKIEKPKSSTDKKPNKDRIEKAETGRNTKPKKIHECAICRKRPYECPEKGCNKRFRQAGCLKNHRASQHGTDVTFNCDLCGKQFPVKERLRLHLRVHSGEKPYKCHVCEKNFARGGQLSQHMVTHTGIKKYKCDFCGSKFSCLANLKIHLKSHLEERDFVCHICSKAFYRRDALKKHISCYHENIKAFHCHICNKMFKGHLPQHMRTHQSIKTHGCLSCGALFSQRSQLIVHQRIHSLSSSFRTFISLETSYKECAVADVAFSQLPHLKKHMLSIHGKDKPYMCEACKEFFKTKQELQQHAHGCTANLDMSKDRIMNDYIKNHHVDPPMSIEKMRLMVTILLKKISSESKLKELGFEKRLIDNILIDSLKCAGRKFHKDENFSEAERLKLNIEEFLEWTIPVETMKVFKEDRKSTEEILENLVGGF
ncbi:CLUMA_CG013314, isoform A [Clunio marinus]|uniref:CLUMA_CG013314, isoform A n=1 Tax=Clunio marinus TaxID=568069 RepID=A0A1J1IJU0_9DIPT|nr:CLUMA_CG013314, isoform A [Clunio marinus]